MSYCKEKEKPCIYALQSGGCVFIACKNPIVTEGEEREATTARSIKVETYTNSTTNLPTAKEYREAAQKSAFQFTAQWSEPKYQCPECGGGMCRDETTVLTSYPPKYRYQCDKCGHIDYQYM